VRGLRLIEGHPDIWRFGADWRPKIVGKSGDGDQPADENDGDCPSQQRHQSEFVSHANPPKPEVP
jgi:hypothetical protein